MNSKFYYDPEAEENGKRADGMFMVNWPDFSRPARFQKRTKHWHHHPEPHGGFYGRLYPFTSMFPLYHFHKLKYNKIMPSSERDSLSSARFLVLCRWD